MVMERYLYIQSNDNHSLFIIREALGFQKIILLNWAPPRRRSVKDLSNLVNRT